MYIYSILLVLKILKKTLFVRKRGEGREVGRQYINIFSVLYQNWVFFFVNMDANNDLETLMNIISKISLDD